MNLDKIPKPTNPAKTDESLPPTPPGVPTTYLPGGRYCPNCGQPIRKNARFCDSCGHALIREIAPPSDGAVTQAIINLVVAVFILLIQPRFGQWVLHSLFGTHFTPFMLNGTAIPYPQVPEFWTDLGPFAFAILLIVDALVLTLVRRQGAIAVMFGLTLIVTFYNASYLVLSFGSQGFAILSFLVVVFGGFMLRERWLMLRGR